MSTAGARLEIPDPRNGGRHLGLSWHAPQRVIVVSHWRDGVCVATTPIELSQVPRLVNLLVGALTEAVATRPPSSEAPSVASVRRDAWAVLRDHVRSRPAPVVTIDSHRAGVERTEPVR